MDITPHIDSSLNIIRSYGDGSYQINETFHEGSILLFPDHVIELGKITINTLDPQELIGHLSAPDAIELLLIGSGNTHQTAPKKLADALKQYQISFDTMNTGAACRTYNVLLSEGRRIGAVLL